jgi:hypothetical protein
VQRLIALLPSTKTSIVLDNKFITNFKQRIQNTAQKTVETTMGPKFKNIAPELFGEIYNKTQPPSSNIANTFQNFGGMLNQFVGSTSDIDSRFNNIINK